MARHVTALAALIATATMLAVAVSSGDEFASTRMSVPMSDAPKRPVSHVPVEVSERLSAFGRARRASDVLPVAVRETVAGQPQYGENPALSRAVVTARGRNRYLVVGDGTVGLYDDGGGGATTDARSALDGEFVSTELCTGSPGFTVMGLLPADASGATLVLRSGARLPLHAIDGVYDVVLEPESAAELPDRVEFTVAGELRTVAVPGSTDDVLTTRCADP